MGRVQENSRDKMYSWLAPQGIVTPLWIPGVWVMVEFHIAETRVDSIIHSLHLRVGWFIETLTLNPTSSHGTVDTIPVAEEGWKRWCHSSTWTIWAQVWSYLDPSYQHECHVLPNTFLAPTPLIWFCGPFKDLMTPNNKCYLCLSRYLVCSMWSVFVVVIVIGNALGR